MGKILFTQGIVSQVYDILNIAIKTCFLLLPIFLIPFFFYLNWVLGAILVSVGQNVKYRVVHISLDTILSVHMIIISQNWVVFTFCSFS